MARDVENDVLKCLRGAAFGEDPVDLRRAVQREFGRDTAEVRSAVARLIARGTVVVDYDQRLRLNPQTE